MWLSFMHQSLTKLKFQSMYMYMYGLFTCGVAWSVKQYSCLCRVIINLCRPLVLCVVKGIVWFSGREELTRLYTLDCTVYWYLSSLLHATLVRACTPVSYTHLTLPTIYSV